MYRVVSQEGLETADCPVSENYDYGEARRMAYDKLMASKRLGENPAAARVYIIHPSGHREHVSSP